MFKKIAENAPEHQTTIYKKGLASLGLASQLKGYDLDVCIIQFQGKIGVMVRDELYEPFAIMPQVTEDRFALIKLTKMPFSDYEVVVPNEDIASAFEQARGYLVENSSKEASIHSLFPFVTENLQAI